MKTRVEKKDAPRTMENCFADGKCDNCGVSFGGRKEIWVWAEHTCCSKACVIKAKRAGDNELSSLHPDQPCCTVDSDSGLL